MDHPGVSVSQSSALSENRQVTARGSNLRHLQAWLSVHMPCDEGRLGSYVARFGYGVPL
jgi:hypothetical protein